MDLVIVVQSYGTYVYTLPPELTPEQAAAGMGVTDPDLYLGFDSSEFTAGYYRWPSCFTLSAGVISFDLAAAKLIADKLLKQQSVATQTELLDGYTAEQIAAQAALPSPSRDVRFQTVINDLNVESAATLQKQVDAAAATTVDDLNAIVFP
jgi:hypothetical protein